MAGLHASGIERRSCGRRFGLFAGLLLVIHANLVGWIALRTSPTIDELGHLAAGLFSLEFGQFDVYRVNPPLVRTLAAAPVALARPATDWSDYRFGPTQRPEWHLGRSFAAANPNQWRRYLTLARWAVAGLSVAGGYVCWRWARELYGDASGLLALALWCFSPNVLAWAATITPDAGAAAIGALAGYAFWKWLRKPSYGGALWAGVALGLAELTKATWILLFGLWPILWLLCRLQRRSRAASGWLPREAGQMAMTLLLGIYVLNVGYGFEGSFQRLGDYRFVSRTLAGAESVTEGGPGGNRFAGTWLGAIPVPLPKNHLSGIDLQKLDFEQGKWSYLNGEWKHGGWWYYYLCALALKVPLGTWLVGLLAIGITVTKNTEDRTAGWRDQLVLLAPAAVVFLLVSSQTGFSRYMRYVLPCFPFVFVWMSKVARAVGLEQWKLAATAGAAVLCSIVSSLSVYPHSMSYFNELAGGPLDGHRYLIDANIDWGQDLFYLKEWIDAHPQARPLHVAVYTFVNPRHMGIDAAVPPPGSGGGDFASNVNGNRFGPLPGWYAISVHRLYDRNGKYAYFFRFAPYALVGYSIRIYRISPGEANRVREEMGLRPLPASSQR